MVFNREVHEKFLITHTVCYYFLNLYLKAPLIVTDQTRPCFGRRNLRSVINVLLQRTKKKKQNEKQNKTKKVMRKNMSGNQMKGSG